MNKSTILLGLMAFVWGSPVGAAWKVEQYKIGDQVQVQSIQKIKINKAVLEPVILRDLPRVIEEYARMVGAEIYQEILYPEDGLPAHVWDQVSDHQADLDRPEGQVWEGSEVRTLIKQGPDHNRITLTIVGDGYTEKEKAKYFADAKRITDDLFSVSTFASYLPLFNVYAVFVPSQDSGITDRVQKKTALGLYRSPRGSKRGIMPGNRDVIERALRLAPAQADYPILMANDDFYGGLGGRYAITTRSLTSGSMVLRHELGHNFGNVGEEYDGGSVYSGANHSRSRNLKWKQWTNGSTEVYENKFLTGKYVWKNFSQKPYRVNFNFPRARNKQSYDFSVVISTVGWESPDDIQVTLDGKKVALSGVYTVDRSFFEIKSLSSLAPGRHTLEFRNANGDSNDVLAFAQVLAHEPGYNFETDKIAGFATFNSWGDHVGYRPTHKTCLMRDMRSNHFCSVDQENMWKRFLKRVSLIDSVNVSDQEVTLEAAHLEGLEITWFQKDQNGLTELSHLKNKRVWPRSDMPTGRYQVKVQFKTDEVKNKNSDFEATRSFSL